jgi:hypothetical protein
MNTIPSHEVEVKKRNKLSSAKLASLQHKLMKQLKHKKTNNLSTSDELWETNLNVYNGKLFFS